MRKKQLLATLVMLSLMQGSVYAETVVNETSETNHMYPRVYSGEIYIEIPIENVKNTESSYTATLTLEVTSK